MTLRRGDGGLTAHEGSFVKSGRVATCACTMAVPKVKRAMLLRDMTDDC